MAIVEMDPELVWKAIEGYADELTPQQKVLDAMYRQFRCKRCGSVCQKEVDAHHTFADPDVLVPRCLLRCLACKALFDPHNDLILEMGNLAELRPTIPIIDPHGKG